jgi:hypothetical protein
MPSAKGKRLPRTGKDRQGSSRTAAGYLVGSRRFVIGNADSLNALATHGARIDTIVLKDTRLIEWGAFGMSLASQADINKLAEPAFGLPASGFVISGYLGYGSVVIDSPMFVAEDAVAPPGRAIGPSKFTLTPGSSRIPGSWVASVSEARGDRIFTFSATRGATLIRVGSEITLPEQFVLVGARYIRNGNGGTPNVIVRKEGLEIQPGTEVLADEWPGIK